MGKFDGLLLCTDLDDTLLTDDKRISDENRAAIEYFMAEGGLFTYATGRVPQGLAPILRQLIPNAPILCSNGAGIYDCQQDKILWSLTLDDRAVEVLEFVDKHFPFSGIEVVGTEHLYFCRINEVVLRHRVHEELPLFACGYRCVPRPWTKVLFMQEEQLLPQVREGLAQTEFPKRYEFVQSSPEYYELLPKGAQKGTALPVLAKLLGIPMERTVAVGDNQNDLTLVRNAGIGVAVANAAENVKAAADFVTVDNNASAIAAVIAGLDIGTKI